MEIMQKVSQERIKKAGIKVILPKDWIKIGYDVKYSLTEDEWERIKYIIGEPGIFFDSFVKDSELLVFVPEINEDAFSLYWWEERAMSPGGLPYNICFNNLYSVRSWVKPQGVEPGWYLITKSIIPNSLNRNWQEHQELFSGINSGYRIPSIHEMVTFYLMSFISGKSLNQTRSYTRTSENYLDLSLVTSFDGKNCTVTFDKDREIGRSNIGVYAIKKIL